MPLSGLDESPAAVCADAALHCHHLAGIGVLSLAWLLLPRAWVVHCHLCPGGLWWQSMCGGEVGRTNMFPLCMFYSIIGIPNSWGLSGNISQGFSATVLSAFAFSIFLPLDQRGHPWCWIWDELSGRCQDTFRYHLLPVRQLSDWWFCCAASLPPSGWIFFSLFLKRSQTSEPLPFTGLAQTCQNTSVGSNRDPPPQLFPTAWTLLFLWS